MSFEKSGKSSGTRHKARECALQMLFARDLVGNAPFSSVDYWSELGYDEIYPRTSQTVGGVRDQIEKLQKAFADLRALFKRIDPVERSNRTDIARELARWTDELDTAYRAYVKIAIANTPRDHAAVLDRIGRIRTRLASLVDDVEATLLKGRIGVTNDDRSQLAEIRSNLNVLDQLANVTLPEIEKIFENASPTRVFSDRLADGTIAQLAVIDERIRTRAEHWRIERMAIVDRNVLRLAVYEFLFEDTPDTVVINEALEIARRFSTYEATQFINGILDAIKNDLAAAKTDNPSDPPAEKSQASSI